MLLSKRQAAAELARRSLCDFARVCQPAIRLTPFHRTYYNTLDRFAHGQIRRLIVSVPPQHGKSLGSSVLLPAYLLGIAPQTRIALGLVQPAARVPLQPPGTTFDERTRLPGRFPRDTAQDVLRKTTERDPHERRIRTDRRSGRSAQRRARRSADRQPGRRFHPRRPI